MKNIPLPDGSARREDPRARPRRDGVKSVRSELQKQLAVFEDTARQHRRGAGQEHPESG